MEAYGAMEVYFYPFLTSVLDGNELVVSRPGYFTSVERGFVSH
jgi:hypothetical protein